MKFHLRVFALTTQSYLVLRKSENLYLMIVYLRLSESICLKSVEPILYKDTNYFVDVCSVNSDLNDVHTHVHTHARRKYGKYERRTISTKEYR